MVPVEVGGEVGGDRVGVVGVGLEVGNALEVGGGGSCRWGLLNKNIQAARAGRADTPTAQITANRFSADHHFEERTTVSRTQREREVGLWVYGLSVPVGARTRRPRRAPQADL